MSDSSPELVPEGGGLPPRTRDRRAERAIRNALRAKLAEDQRAARLIQQESEKLQQVISLQQPKEKKVAESAPDEPDEGQKQDPLSPLEMKRAEPEPDEEGTGLVRLSGVTVSGNHSLSGKLSGLQVFAVRVPGVPADQQRIFAFDGASVYYTMQAGSSAKTRTRFTRRGQLPDAQKASEDETLQFAGYSTEKDILGGGAAEGAPPPTPQAVPLQRSGTRILLDSSGGNLYVRNHFLIAVAGGQFSYLTVPDANDGTHLPWYLVVNTPNNSTPDKPQAVTGQVLVMGVMQDYGGSTSGQAHLQWAGGRTLGSGRAASARRALTVDDLPALMEGGKIHGMYTRGNSLTLIVDRDCLDDFGLEVKAQPRPPASPEQTQRVGWIERELRQLDGNFRRNTALYEAAGDEAAPGIIVAELDGGVHLSIMAADLQQAIQSVDGQGLQGGAFARAVFQACPYHVTIGLEHWHSPQQTGANGFLSGKYSDDRLIRQRDKMRSADDLDWAIGEAEAIGFTIR